MALTPAQRHRLNTLADMIQQDHEDLVTAQLELASLDDERRLRDGSLYAMVQGNNAEARKYDHLSQIEHDQVSQNIRGRIEHKRIDIARCEGRMESNRIRVQIELASINGHGYAPSGADAVLDAAI